MIQSLQQFVDLFFLMFKRCFSYLDSLQFQVFFINLSFLDMILGFLVFTVLISLFFRGGRAS